MTLQAAEDDGDVKPLVLVEANWQARPMLVLLSKTPAIAALVELRQVEDQEERDSILSIGDDRIGRLVGFWQQVTDFWSSGRWGRPQTLPDGVSVTRFPYLSSRCFWPIAGSDPRSIPEPLYPSGRYPYSDRHAASVGADHSDLDEASLYETYLAASREDLVDIEQVVLQEIAVAAERDALCEVHFADFMARNYRTTRLFHAPDSPAGPAYVALAEALAASLETALGVDEGVLVAALRRHARGFQGIVQFQYPVDPAIVETLQLEWADPKRPVRYGKNLWTHQQAMTRAITWADWTP